MKSTQQMNRFSTVHFFPPLSAYQPLLKSNLQSKCPVCAGLCSRDCQYSLENKSTAKNYILFSMFHPCRAEEEEQGLQVRPDYTLCVSCGVQGGGGVKTVRGRSTQSSVGARRLVQRGGGSQG